MKITSITIEYKPTCAEDVDLLNGEVKRISFKDMNGWRMEGPVFPSDIKLVDMLNGWLKQHWASRTGEL